MADMSSQRLHMQDPRTQYPRPPFPRQPQRSPRLDDTREPRPEHGETSSRGHSRLAGRKALVTGDNSGIGRAAAIASAREGADIATVSMPEEEADVKEVVQIIQSEGRKAAPLTGDITDESFCTELVEKAVAGLGGLDIILHNAANETTQAGIGDITSRQFDRTLRTNLYAMFWITKAAPKVMPPGGAVIDTTSVQAYHRSQALVDDVTTKAGIQAFTEALARQVIDKGIRMNAVAPGPFWTALQPSGGQTRGKIENFEASVPTGRPGQPVELAPIYVLLASQESS